MKLLAISDTYIPFDFMSEGLAELQNVGIDIEVRHWEHKSLINLQEDNLAIETGGPDAVQLPDEITRNLEPYDIVVVQFAPISKSFIEKTKNLKLIGTLRGGAENIDVIPRYSEAEPWLRKALDLCARKGLKCEVDHIPPCSLGHHWARNVDIEKMRIGADGPHLSEKKKTPQCRGCRFSGLCPGPRKDYMAVYGRL